jgi:hypothetical protein
MSTCLPDRATPFDFSFVVSLSLLYALTVSHSFWTFLYLVFGLVNIALWLSLPLYLSTAENSPAFAWAMVCNRNDRLLGTVWYTT